MKKIIIFLIVIVFLIVFFVVAQKDEVVSEIEPLSQESSSLCYYSENLTQSGLYDRSWLRLNLIEEKVSGEYYNLPAEKDSKFGSFKGVYAKDNLGVISRADVLWEAQAEGTVVAEQLFVNFSFNEAFVGFGEMTLGENDVYVYSDPKNIPYWQTIPTLPCGDLDEHILVGKYIRENIATLASEEPVLGGSWYVISAVVNPLENTVAVVYEDGHIQGTTTFAYEISEGTVVIQKEI